MFAAEVLSLRHITYSNTLPILSRFFLRCQSGVGEAAHRRALIPGNRQVVPVEEGDAVPGVTY